MPVIEQSRIYRADLRANPNVIYVFGDNVRRVGYGGQAGQMRDEPNAIGVATKWTPSMNEEAFFNDQEFDKIKAIIKSDLVPVVKAALEGKVIVLPLDGLGTGLSELPGRAPKVFKFLQQELRAIIDSSL